MFVNLVVIIWRQAVWDLKPVAAGCVSRLLCYYQADAFVLTRKINRSILILAILDKQLFPAITYLVFFLQATPKQHNNHFHVLSSKNGGIHHLLDEQYF